MAYSYTEYTASSVTTSSTFTVPPYLDGRGFLDISVTLDGVTQAGSAYSLTGTSLSFTSSYLPADGVKIRITRNSSQGARLTDFNDAALLTADALDQDALQLFYMAQEAIDVSSETNLNGSTFYVSSSTQPSTTVAGSLWYDTSSAPNVLKVYNGTAWVYAAPIRTSNRFVLSDMTAHSGSKQYVASSLFTSQSEVYLNGVRLLVASNIGNVGGAGTNDPVGDYYFRGDTTPPRIYVENLSSSDILEIVTT
tara:strand:+ start:2654 stop:3406 length:753 start_codon:yes stop_codon:yes gene_type:complete